MISDWDEKVQHYADNISRFTTLHAEDLIGTLYHDIRSANTILDVGCGAGAFGLAYLKYFPNGIEGQTLILSDLSQGMVNKARNVLEARTKSVDFKTKIDYRVEDGSDLKSVESNSIDVLVSIFGVFVFPDRAKTLKTIQRVLRKDSGVFGTAAWTSLNNLGLQKQGFGAGFHDTMEDSLGKLSNLHQDGKRPAPWKEWFEPSKIHQMLVNEAGFASVAVHRSIHSVNWSSAKELWEVVAAKNPTSKCHSAEPGEAQAARARMMKLVGASNDDSPVFLWTASNLAVAKGFPSNKLP